MKNKTLIIIVLVVIIVVVFVLLSKRDTSSTTAVPVEEVPVVVSEFPSPDKVRAITHEKAAHHGHDHGEQGEHAHDDHQPAAVAEEAVVDAVQEIVDDGTVQDIVEDVAEVAAEPVDIPANTPLALVNGIPVTLSDLVAERPEDQGLPVRMEAMEYAARLDKAIETEVTYQAARESGVELSDDQVALVHGIGDRKRADVEAYRQKGMTWTTVTEEQIAFQEHQAAAVLLQQNMMAKAGIPTAPVLTDVQIDTYYQANKAQFGELPEEAAARDQAWSTIHDEIVQILFPYIQNQTAEQQKQFLEGLISKNTVEVVPLDAE